MSAEKEGFRSLQDLYTFLAKIFLKSILGSKGFRIPHESFPSFLSNFTLLNLSCGKGGIRTLEELSPLLVFETSAFNLSATFPYISPCSNGNRICGSWLRGSLEKLSRLRTNSFVLSPSQPLFQK